MLSLAAAVTAIVSEVVDVVLPTIVLDPSVADIANVGGTASPIAMLIGTAAVETLPAWSLPVPSTTWSGP